MNISKYIITQYQTNDHPLSPLSQSREIEVVIKNNRIIHDIGQERKSDRGFTILEVIIALAIVAISLTAFIKLLGNSTMLRTKVNDYDDRYDVAIIKTEQAFLGLLDLNNDQGDDKKKWQGTTADSGINWIIEKGKDDDSEENNENVYFYTVFVDGIEVSSVGKKNARPMDAGLTSPPKGGLGLQ